jgi:predicted nucleic acid-binding protein
VLIALERIRRQRLLPKLFGKVLITPKVREEVFGKRRLPRWVIVKQVCQDIVEEVARQTGLKPEKGETEAIALAYRLQTILLIDDRKGRKAAQKLGVPVMGTLKLLLEAKRKGILRQVKPLLVALEQTGRYLDEQLRRWVLEEAEEVSCDGGACLFGAGCWDAKCQGASH